MCSFPASGSSWESLARGGVTMDNSWRWQRDAALVLLILAALALASVVAMYRTRDVVRPNQEPLQLAFEIRLPPGAAPALTTAQATLITDMNTIPATLREARQDNDRMVIAGTVELRFHTSVRFLELRIGQEPGRVFELKLPASPSPTDSFSDWTHVDYINEGDSGCCASNNPPAYSRRAGPSDEIDIRYQVIEPAAER